MHRDLKGSIRRLVNRTQCDRRPLQVIVERCGDGAWGVFALCGGERLALNIYEKRGTASRVAKRAENEVAKGREAVAEYIKTRYLVDASGQRVLHGRTLSFNRPMDQQLRLGKKTHVIRKGSPARICAIRGVPSIETRYGYVSVDIALDLLRGDGVDRIWRGPEAANLVCARTAGACPLIPLREGHGWRQMGGRLLVSIRAVIDSAFGSQRR